MKVKEILEASQPVWINNISEHEYIPKVSVLLPTYRRAKSGLLEKCINSVLNQTFKELELIIIDDASTDGSKNIIEQYMKKDARVKCIRHTYNVGLPAISEYEGYVKSTGDIIAFIFDDCIWELDYLAKVMDIMWKNKAINCCYSRVRFFYGKNPDDYVLVGGSSEITGAGTNCLPSYNFIPNSGIVIRRNVIEDSRCGLYDPHVAMTRLCDWALWKRIDSFYTLYETELVAGSEYGVSSKDSLGNTYDMHLLSALEREVESNNIIFSPDLFEEIEIDYCSENSSESYVRAVQSLKSKFKEKKWYKEEYDQGCSEKRKIIYVLGEITATLQISILSFSRSKKSNEYLFRFAGKSFDVSDALQSDAIICVRNQCHAGVDWLEFCEKYNIPVYYFTDDNFEVLKQDYSDQFIAEEALRWNKERLCAFDGIIVMSENLKRYFVQTKNIPAEKIYILPGMSAEHIVQKSEDDGIITCVYMGGSWRNKYFMDNFYPELKKVAAHKNIRLVISDDEDLKDIETDNIDVIRLKRRLNLSELIREIRTYSPDYWLHCGSGQPNDIYKNPNALWNALSVGAELIVNEIHPYMDEGISKVIYTVNTNISLYDIIMNNEYCSDELYEKSISFYKKYYSVDVNLEAYNKAFNNIESCGKYDYARRLETYIKSEGTTKNIDDGNIIKRREVDSRLLRLSKLTNSKCKYCLLCFKDTISCISVIFTSYEDNIYDGYVQMELKYKGNLVRKSVVSMLDIHNNQWTDFSFEPLEGISGKKIEVTLNFIFSGIKKKYGVYEFAPNLTMLIRGLKKVGVKSKGVNLLFYDAM